jgi:hypothetical protein
VAERTIQAAGAMQRARQAFEAAAAPLVERGAATGRAVGQIALEFARLTAALDGYGERLGAVLARHVGELNEATGQIQSRTNEAGAALMAQAQAVAALQSQAGVLLQQLQDGAVGAGHLTRTLSDRLEAAAAVLTEKAAGIAATTDATTQRGEALLEVFAEAELGASARARDLAKAGASLEAQLADLARRAADITSSAVAAAERASHAEAAMGSGAEATLTALRAGAQWVADSCSRSAAELREVIAAMRASQNAPPDRRPALSPEAAEQRRLEFLRATRLVLEGLSALGGDLRRALVDPAQDDGALRQAIQARAAGDAGFAAARREFVRQYAETLARAREADREGVLPLTLLASALGRIYTLLLAAERRE